MLKQGKDVMNQHLKQLHQLVKNNQLQEVLRHRKNKNQLQEVLRHRKNKNQLQQMKKNLINSLKKQNKLKRRLRNNSRKLLQQQLLWHLESSLPLLSVVFAEYSFVSLFASGRAEEKIRIRAPRLCSCKQPTHKGV